MQSACLFEALGMCFVPAEFVGDKSIFGFSEFLTSVAIIAAAYTLSDERYRFRISVSRLPLTRLLAWITVAVGLGLLTTNFWFAQSLPLPRFLNNKLIFDVTFAVIVFSTIVFWINVAFVNPPVFNKRNAVGFSQQIYWIIASGSREKVTAVVPELLRSIEAIVRIARSRKRMRSVRGGFESRPTSEAKLANHILLMMGDRRVCKIVANQYPSVGIAVFEEVAVSGLGNLPMAQFSRNLANELFKDVESALFHEEDGFYVGRFGYDKPVSKAIFGNFRLIEDLSGKSGSPLDLLWLETHRWEAKTWKVYERCALIFLESYLSQDDHYSHSLALAQMFGGFENISVDLYRINNLPDGGFDSVTYQKFKTGLDFIEKAIVLLDKYPAYDENTAYLPIRGKDFRFTLYGRLVEMALNLMLSSASITDDDLSWTIQHNVFWNDVFPTFSKRTKPRTKFERLLRRGIYEEIKQMNRWPNYKSAKILGVSLNVMGLNIDVHHRAPEENALKKVVLRWTTRNFMRIITQLPDIEKSCVLGTISFDSERRRLVKTYKAGLRRVAPVEVLQLDEYLPTDVSEKPEDGPF